MAIARVGRSYRATFDSSLRHVLLGLVPAASGPVSPPRMVALPMHRNGAPASIDPARVLREVTRALREIEANTGVAIPLEAIEYVPNDSPYYEKYYSLALDLGRHLTRGR
jgi:hypothetical protein